MQSQSLLHNGAHVGKHHVRRGCADNDEINFGPVYAGILNSLERSPVGQVAGGLIVRGNMTALDARARPNPLVGGIDHLLQIEIGQHPFREITTDAGYARIHCEASSSMS